MASGIRLLKEMLYGCIRFYKECYQGAIMVLSKMF